MTEATIPPGNGNDARAAALLAHFERAGYLRAEPAILQPAEPFLDLSGEDIRRRMFLTSDASGRELCLRPDLTIPVARDYLASPAAGKPAGFCYLGPVFRDRGDAPSEFLQAGIESFGRRDIAAADAEALSLAIEAAAHYGLNAPKIRMGDVGLFAALIEAFELPPAWRRRLMKDFDRRDSLTQDLDRMVLNASTGRPEYHGVLAALAGADPQGAHALVTDLLSIAGIQAVGGRSIDEIADRFLEQSSLGAGARLPQVTRAVIQRFLSLTGHPDEAAANLRALATDAAIALDAALDLFESRLGFLAARGVDLNQIHFSTAYGSGWDYYTGFMFRLQDSADEQDKPLVAGGRYDAMLGKLGSPDPIPAVGFAVWPERLARLRGAA
jgi:ATP phosphoribosyltransferase regulatory subunit